MHIRKFTRRLTPWLTLYLLVVSIGLPLQRVYCACIGESELSLPGRDHDCEAHSAKITEHDHHRMACCLATKECQTPELSEHKCGSSEVVVAALDADFLLETVGDYSIVPSAGLMPSWPAYLPLAAQVVAKTRPIRGPDPPDRRSGRDLLVAHQTFLI
ncbi:hypothetical protein FUA23_04440 [Neolewinella aurantiaca]|uniref:Uncharacterized protein n=1 Tax=Neolewinella aurantiaca TaxID=2602767 RepID=A0A5C7FHK1_9BACT|nr:hypothetical protein [Neolewinella aurantiaca]TXF90694.1 hypothetical protein FUA23_04440 [Neolewinella aurantiaca]